MSDFRPPGDPEPPREPPDPLQGSWGRDYPPLQREPVVAVSLVVMVLIGGFMGVVLGLLLFVATLP